MCVCLAGQLVTASPSAVPHKHQNQSKSNPRTVPSSPRRVMQKVTAPSSPSAAALSPASMASRVSFLRVFLKKRWSNQSDERRQASKDGRSVDWWIDRVGRGGGCRNAAADATQRNHQPHARGTHVLNTCGRNRGTCAGTWRRRRPRPRGLAGGSRTLCGVLLFCLDMLLCMECKYIHHMYVYMCVVGGSSFERAPIQVDSHGRTPIRADSKWPGGGSMETESRTDGTHVGRAPGTRRRSPPG